MCTQATIPTSLKQPSPKSYEEVIKVALPTSILEVIKEPNFTNSTIMVPPSPLPTNMVSSSISTNLEVQYSPNINYFANLTSDSDKSDDEFDQFTIPYLTNLIVHESLPHFRILTYFDSSITIVKARVLELEKMISIYQTNMGKFERTKLNCLSVRVKILF
jgi:hypothetical protein